VEEKEGSEPMVKIFFVDADGTECAVETDAIGSVMEAACLNGVDGIVAECGGHAMCGTCHVYVTSEWQAELPAIEPDEDERLNWTACPRQPNSRLSCQLRVTTKLDGLRLHLPERQL
jgi:2Fe-2S ferredoxin